jgi:hypothetical protein
MNFFKPSVEKSVETDNPAVAISRGVNHFVGMVRPLITAQHGRVDDLTSRQSISHDADHAEPSSLGFGGRR